MIDHDQKETHIGLDESGEVLQVGLKTCHWKNGFHSLEHALIGYLSGQNYFGKRIKLHYAFETDIKPGELKLGPYYYSADVLEIEQSEFENTLFENLKRSTVTFENIK